MDGNGRWAQKRFLPRVAGHKQGVDALRQTVQACIDRGLQVLTVFAFSSENWNRPVEEVSGLMDLLALALSREVPKLHRSGVQLHFPGDRAALSPRVQKALAQAEAMTAGNRALVLNVCFNYGGRWDIAQAARRLAAEGRAVVYTTHYMEEAERACGRVAIIDHGRMLDIGTVAELLARHGGESLEDLFLQLTGRSVRD